MLPDILLLFALLLGFHDFEAAAGGVAPDLLRGLGGTAAATLVAIVLSGLTADRTARRMAEDGAEAALPGSRSPMLHPLVAWVACLFAFGWGGFVAAAIPRSWFVLPHVVYFLPLALTSVAAWIAVDRGESAIVGRPSSARRALSRGLRRNALVLVPVAVVLLVHRGFVALDAAGVRAAGRVLDAYRAYPDLVSLTLGLGVLVFLVAAPAILRRALGAVPLPAGETRDAVSALLDRLDVRRRDVLLWATQGRIRNAWKIGISPRTRYVILSDGLLETFPRPELLAVVAHEAAHVKRAHFLLLSLSLASLVLVFLGLGTLLAPHLPGSSETTLAIVVLWFGWFGIVRRLSRRFEREADVFAAQHAADGDPTAATEERAHGMSPGAARAIAALARTARVGDGGLRHDPTRVRTAYVAAWDANPALRERHARGERSVRLGILALAAFAIGLTVLRAPAALARGRAAMTFYGAEREVDTAIALRGADPAQAKARYREAYERFRGVVRDADAIESDSTMRVIAASAEHDAADIALRELDETESARAGFEKVLARLDALDARDEVDVSPIRHAALIELGRIALRRTDDPAAGLASARARLTAANAIASSSSEAEAGYRRARARLLEASIAFRSPDPAESARGRRDLEIQALGTRDDGARWLELADDASAELKRAPTR